MSMLGAGGAYVRIHIFANQGSFIMRKTLLLIASTILLSALPGCASYCCNNYCNPCGSSCQPWTGHSWGGQSWGGQMGACCDSWMDGTDACVEGFCQQNSQVKGLLKESYRSSRQTLKGLYAGGCGTGCGVSQCGGCQECEQFGPPAPPCGCSGKCKGHRPVWDVKIPKWRPSWKCCWKPKWSNPWKKKQSCGCQTCGATGGSCGPTCGAGQGNCNCGTGHFDHPAGEHPPGYSYVGEDESLGMSPQGNGGAPTMPGAENYFVSPSQPGGMPYASGQQPIPVPPLAPPSLMPESARGMPMQGGMVPPAAMESAQQLPPPLPEGSPRGLQWRAVSSYRESFPAPPAADEQEATPMKTPSKVLTPVPEGSDEFEAPLIIDGK